MLTFPQPPILLKPLTILYWPLGERQTLCKLINYCLHIENNISWSHRCKISGITLLKLSTFLYMFTLEIVVSFTTCKLVFMCICNDHVQGPAQTFCLTSYKNYLYTCCIVNAICI